VPKKSIARKIPALETLIYEIRGQRVMLDSDLARIYEIPTKAFNQAVKRNLDKFPADFMFRLTAKEAGSLRHSRSQVVTLKRGQNIKYPPYVFTEHGALQASQRSSQPARCANERIRGPGVSQNACAPGRRARPGSKTCVAGKELKKRLDVHEVVIVTILQRVMDIIDPPALPAPPPKPRIGFNP